MITWTIFPEAAKVYGGHVMVGDILGFLPGILRPEDPRPAKEQLADRYAHGGGFSPFGKGQWILTGMTLSYPGDPPMRPVAGLKLPHSQELVLLYPHQMVAIIKDERSFDVVRLD